MPNPLRVIGSLRKWARYFDALLEKGILRTHVWVVSGPFAYFCLSLLPLAALVKFLTGPHDSIDLFVPTLMFCCAVFRYRGFFCLLLAAALDLLVKASEVWRIGNPDLWPKFLLHTLVSLAGWFLICSFVIITLEKWSTLRQLKNRTDDDLELAKSLQSSLARKTCELQRVSICGSIHQCASVGGDFYYFRPFGKKMVSFCLGDVMGKGISASLLMAMVMSFVYEWGKQSSDPANIAGRLNKRLSLLWDGRKGWFITIFYGILDEETGVLEYTMAGQQGGFILRGQELIEFEEDCDPPLGVAEDFPFSKRSVQLKPGDHLLFYTDGVYEAKSPRGDLFGTERLGELFKQLSKKHEAPEMLERIERAVLEHTGGEYTDDTTLLSLRYT